MKVVNFTETQWRKLLDIFLNTEKSSRLKFMKIMISASVEDLTEENKDEIAYTLFSLFKDNYVKEDSKDGKWTRENVLNKDFWNIT